MYTSTPPIGLDPNQRVSAQGQKRRSGYLGMTGSARGNDRRPVPRFRHLAETVRNERCCDQEDDLTPAPGSGP